MPQIPAGAQQSVRHTPISPVGEAPQGSHSLRSQPDPGAARWWRAATLMQILCIVCLVALSVITMMAWSSLNGFAASSGAPKPDPPVQNSTVSPATQAQVDAAVAATVAQLRTDFKNTEEQHRALLDRLVGLVGAYSLLISLTAFFSLKAARDEAQSQIALGGSQLAGNLAWAKEQVQLLLEGAALRQEDIHKEWDKFQTVIWTDLPDMRTMQEGLRTLLFYLQSILPKEADWNDRESYTQLTPTEKQEILLAETTIAALPTLISRHSPANNSSLAQLYRALARFYSARYQDLKQVDDASRSNIYLLRAKDLEPKSALTYRLLGTNLLVQHRLQVEGATLKDAMMNLDRALELDPKELGAIYNKSLALERLGSRREGIQLVDKALADLEPFPLPLQRKYLPSLALNQACDLDLQAREDKNALETAEAWLRGERILIDAIERSYKEKNLPGLADLEKRLESEFNGGGDLGDWEPDRKARVLQRFDPAWRRTNRP